MALRNRDDYRPVKQWYKKGGEWIETNHYTRNARKNHDPRSSTTKASMKLQEEREIKQYNQIAHPQQPAREAAPEERKSRLSGLSLEDLIKVLILFFLAIIIKDLTS